MAATLTIPIAMMVLWIGLATAQPEQPKHGKIPPQDRTNPGPCRLTDDADVELVSRGCLQGRDCGVGPVKLTLLGITTVKAYYCDPSIIPHRFQTCRIENSGVVVGEERTCPDGATCDIGPQYYSDGEVLLSAFYCRHNEAGARLCAVTDPGGSVVGERDCPDGLVCERNEPVTIYENNYSVHGCRRPIPPPNVCSIVSSNGAVVRTLRCRDGSSCGTEAFEFVFDDTTYTIYYCLGNENEGSRRSSSEKSKSSKSSSGKSGKTGGKSRAGGKGKGAKGRGRRPLSGRGQG